MKVLIAKNKLQERQLEEAARREWEQREKKLQGVPSRETTTHPDLSDIDPAVPCLALAEVQAAKSKEEEEVPLVELTPEERAVEIVQVEKELETLEERKHLYFLGLKKVGLLPCMRSRVGFACVSVGSCGARWHCFFLGHTVCRLPDATSSPCRS